MDKTGTMNTDRGQEKKRKEARWAEKSLSVASLGFMQNLAHILVHSELQAGHWGMEETFHTAADLGGILLTYSGWMTALDILRGEDKTPFPMLHCLALMLISSGVALPDLYQRKDPFLYLFGVPLALGMLLILVRIVSEAMTQRKRRRTRPGRG